MNNSYKTPPEKRPAAQESLALPSKNPIPISDHRIAALVIHYIDPAMTMACLNSLAEASTIVVWDNTEDGGISLAKLRKALPEEVSSRCIFATQGVNLGFARGMNSAQRELLRHCNPRCIVAVNNDAVISQGGLGKLADALSDPKTALAGANVQTKGQSTGRLYYNHYTGLITANRLPGSFPYLCGCCLMWRAADYPTGPFDETFFMYGEDTELSWRTQKMGKRISLIENAIVSHTGGSSSDPHGQFYEMQTTCMHYLLARRLGFWKFKTPLQLPIITLFLLMRAIVRSLRHQSMTPIICLAKTLLTRGSSPHIAKERQPTDQ